MKPRTNPKRSSTTFTTGTRQFVVQEALETTWCLAGSYRSWFTPITIVMSSPLAGAEITTFFAPAARCFAAWSRSVKRSEEHTFELQSRPHLVCRLLLEQKKSTLEVSSHPPIEAAVPLLSLKALGSSNVETRYLEAPIMKKRCQNPDAVSHNGSRRSPPQ